MTLKPWEVIKLLQAEDSKLAKEAILKAHHSADLEAGLRLALDPAVMFNIKKLPLWEKAGVDFGSVTMDDFAKLCQSLNRREITGNAAKNAVTNFMMGCEQYQWDLWYSRILLKDMKCGMQVSTWNRAFPDNEIYIFECQLATDSDKDLYDEILGMDECYQEPKYDGVRAISFVYPDGKVEIFSRNGNQFFNFKDVEASLSKIKVKEPMMFDGEMMSKNFQKIMTQVNRKSDVDTSDSHYHVFDCMPKVDFDMKRCHLIQKERKAILFSLLAGHEDDRVFMGPYKYIEKGDKVQSKAYFDELVALGFEGMMIKPVDGLYTFKRSKAWLKMKPFIDVTLTITGAEIGEPGKEYADSLGALICEGVDKGKSIKVFCGGGFTDKMRAQLWANITGNPVVWKSKVKGKWVETVEQPEGDPVIGRMCDVRADCLTLADGETVYSLRFPRFIRFREKWDL